MRLDDDDDVCCYWWAGSVVNAIGHDVRIEQAGSGGYDDYEAEEGDAELEELDHYGGIDLRSQESYCGDEPLSSDCADCCLDGENEENADDGTGHRDLPSASSQSDASEDGTRCTPKPIPMGIAHVDHISGCIVQILLMLLQSDAIWARWKTNNGTRLQTATEIQPDNANIPFNTPNQASHRAFSRAARQSTRLHQTLTIAKSFRSYSSWTEGPFYYHRGSTYRALSSNHSKSTQPYT